MTEEKVKMIRNWLAIGALGFRLSLDALQMVEHNLWASGHRKDQSYPQE